jgi:hypothetical protein
MKTTTGEYPQGVCCHEAGHAVVAFSLGVRVVTVSVFFSEENGWKGATNAEGTDHLNLGRPDSASRGQEGRRGGL